VSRSLQNHTKVFRHRLATQSEPPHRSEGNKKGGLQARTSGQGGAVTLTQKVVEGGKDTGYLLGILGGLALIGAAVYQLGKAWLDPCSPQRIFSRASDLIRKDPEVQKLLGPHIKCFGDETGRGHRRNLNSVTYLNTNTNELHTRVVFTVEGDTNTALALAETTSSGQFYVLTLHLPVTGEKLVFTNEGKFQLR